MAFPTDPARAFCAIAQGRADADLVALRTERVLVIPTLMERAAKPGHTLVLSVDHVTDLGSAPAGLRAELFDVVARVTDAVRVAYDAVGSTVVQNNHAPGQVLHHLHIGVIPRCTGDGYRVPDARLTEGVRETRRLRAMRLRDALTATEPARDGDRGVQKHIAAYKRATGVIRADRGGTAGRAR